MRIGIDVGGTNTDCVVMDGDSVVAATKTVTTADVSSGIVQALSEIQATRPFAPAAIEAVMIGTTHFVNAFVEGSRLAPTAALRLGLPATASLPPMVDWPERLITAVQGRAYLAHGGNEFDGRAISELEPDELRRHAADMASHGIRAVAVSSVFSPVSNEFEVRAAQIIAEVLGPDIPISLSSEIGRIGLLGRENATIANAALSELADLVVSGLASSLEQQGILAPLYLSQNDGTLMDSDYARRYPISTFASGPTNSMRGAAALSGVDDCAVVDVGGTTTDVGVIVGGFPREANSEVDIAGIRTNFRMPDVVTAGIGGGSLIHDHSGAVTVGPESVGRRLDKEALVFGGSTTTATDIAVAAGRIDVGDPKLVAHLPKALVRSAIDKIAFDIADLVERMRTSPDPLPVVTVGGGAVLLPSSLPGLGESYRPENYSVANAIGAAIAQISGEVDQVFAMEPGKRDVVVDQARQLAVDRAVAAGADPANVHIVELDEVPLPYLPGNATRVRCKAVGDLRGIGR